MSRHCTYHWTNYWFQTLLLPKHGHNTTLLQMEKASTNIQPETSRQEYNENTTQTNRDEDNENTTQTIQKHKIQCMQSTNNIAT